MQYRHAGWPVAPGSGDCHRSLPSMTRLVMNDIMQKTHDSRLWRSLLTSRKLLMLQCNRSHAGRDTRLGPANNKETFDVRLHRQLAP